MTEIRERAYDDWRSNVILGPMDAHAEAVAHEAFCAGWEAKRERCAQRPRIVCLCGSTRFMDAFHAAGWERTLAREIVLSVGVAKHVQTADGGHVAEALGPGVPEALDELHKRKIDLADYVLVLNVGGYIGDSTRSEIEYAEAHGKPVRYLDASEPCYVNGATVAEQVREDRWRDATT